ncbi:MAG: insulinase family protein [Bryobacterales bacterium]|nr:insulinase family protein [Bryobacterales bacterium]
MKALIVFVTAAALLGQQSKPPETPPLQPFKLPQIKERKLGNGLTVLLAEDQRIPLVTLRLAFVAGSRFDPEGKSGLSETVASLLKEGTASRNSRQIAEELADIGANLDVNSNADGLTVSGNVLSGQFAALLELTSDVVRNASFPEDEIKLRKQNRAQELAFQRSQSSTLASEKVRSVLFGAHPYSRYLPSPASVNAITRSDLMGFRDRLLTPANAVLVLIGAIPGEQQTMDMLRARFESWTNKPVPTPPSGEAPKAARKLVVIDRPGSAQVDIMTGHATVNRLQADYFPLIVGTAILGGGASSRLFLNLRERDGFAYQANAMHVPFRDTGYVSAITQVRPEVLEPAMKGLFAEMDKMAAEPVTSQELSNVKNYLNGFFVIGLESQGGLANQLAALRVAGAPLEYLEQYVTRVRSVEPDQIQRVAAKYMTSKDAAIVVVGDAGKIAKTVEKFGAVQVEKAQ